MAHHSDENTRNFIRSAGEKSSHPDGDAQRRKAFAKAMAKAEFGRFYWDEEQARRLAADAKGHPVQQRPNRP